MKQLTLKDSFAVSGKGLHSGLQINAVFNPAPENTGYNSAARISKVNL